MSAQSPVARWTRIIFSGRNPVAGVGDRVESAVLVIGVLVTLLALPVAAAIGSEVHAERSAASEAQLSTRHRTDAVLVADAPAGRATTETAVERSKVLAEWTTPKGTRVRGEVTADNGSPAGSTVEIWQDGNGSVTRPPLTAQGALVTAVFVAVAAWLAVGVAMTLLYALVRLAHQRVRLRQWQSEWALVEPAWRRMA